MLHFIRDLLRVIEQELSRELDRADTQVRYAGDLEEAHMGVVTALDSVEKAARV